MTTQILPPAAASAEEQEAAARLEILNASADYLEGALRELAEYRRARTTPPAAKLERSASAA